MTAQQLQQLLDNIIAGVNDAADYAGIIDPELIPFIVIGEAIDKLVPGIAAHVAAWAAGNPPTVDEKADFVAKLAVLGNPNVV